MAIPFYPSSIRLSRIRDEFDTADPVPYKFSDYYSGAKTPQGTEGFPSPSFSAITQIPSAGPIKFSNFYGSEKVYSAYIGSIPHFADYNGTLPGTEFGGAITEDSTFYGRASNKFISFSTRSRTSGYTLNISSGIIYICSTWSNFWDWFSSWQRYYNSANYGYQLLKSDGTHVATIVANASTYRGFATYIDANGDQKNTYHRIDLPAQTINLNSNTSYRLHWYIEFQADSYRGDTAGGYSGGRSFWGYSGLAPYLTINSR